MTKEDAGLIWYSGVAMIALYGILDYLVNTYRKG